MKFDRQIVARFHRIKAQLHLWGGRRLGEFVRGNGFETDILSLPRQLTIIRIDRRRTDDNCPTATTRLDLFASCGFGG